jgi:hypothetical protein
MQNGEVARMSAALRTMRTVFTELRPYIYAQRIYCNSTQNCVPFSVELLVFCLLWFQNNMQIAGFMSLLLLYYIYITKPVSFWLIDGLSVFLGEKSREVATFLCR